MEKSEFEFRSSVQRMCKQKSFEDAKAMCEEALRHEEDSECRAFVLACLSSVHERSGNYHEAKSRILQSLKESPERRGSVFQLMQLHSELEQWEKVIETADDLLALDGKFKDAAFTIVSRGYQVYAAAKLSDYRSAKLYMNTIPDDVDDFMILGKPPVWYSALAAMPELATSPP